MTHSPKIGSPDHRARQERLALSRDDIGAASRAERERLQACVDELTRDRHRLELENAALRREVEELHALRDGAPWTDFPADQIETTEARPMTTP